MFSAGDHLVLDNANIHHYEAGDVLVDWLVQQQAWLIYTPTYSPEFNLAELVFNYIIICNIETTWCQTKCNSKSTHCCLRHHLYRNSTNDVWIY